MDSCDQSGSDLVSMCSLPDVTSGREAVPGAQSHAACRTAWAPWGLDQGRAGKAGRSGADGVENAKRRASSAPRLTGCAMTVVPSKLL
jgi:hypothetical protein